MGNALIYVYPALMFRCAVQNMGEEAPIKLRKEVTVALMTAVLGIIMGLIGARMVILKLNRK